LTQVRASRAARWSAGNRSQRSIEMIEFEFDGALQLSSGIAEALHAAGADVGVPAPDDAALPDETGMARGGTD
jgi:hypothetical protein